MSIDGEQGCFTWAVIDNFHAGTAVLVIVPTAITQVVSVDLLFVEDTIGIKQSLGWSGSSRTVEAR